MEPIEIPYKFTPRSYQLPLFEAFNSGKYNRYLWRASRRSGKDLTCTSIVGQGMFQRVGTYYYFFPTYQQGRKILWEGKDREGTPFLDRIPPQWVAGRDQQQLKITLKNGSILRIVAADEYDSVVGTNPVGMVFSEWALCNPAVWDFMRPILLENKGWAIFNGTPRGENHMFTMETLNENNPNWFIMETQSLWPERDNYWPVVSQEDIQEERRSGMEESMIEQEYGVSYVAGVKGAYYSDQVAAAKKEGRVGKYLYNSNLPVQVYTDLGIMDDTVLWFRQVDGNRIIWLDYYEASGKDLQHYAKVIVERGYPSLNSVWLPHDGGSRSRQTGLTDREVLQRHFMNLGAANIAVYCADKPGNKQVAINAVRSRFSRYHFDDVKCAIGLKKVSLYHRKWDSAHQCFSATPEHDWTSNAADALSTEALTAKLNDGYSNNSLWLPKDLITDFDPRDI